MWPYVVVARLPYVKGLNWDVDCYYLINKFTVVVPGFLVYNKCKEDDMVRISMTSVFFECHISFSSAGLESDESCEGLSEASFKDAQGIDSSSQKNNGSVPQENGIKKHRYSCIPHPHSICCVCTCLWISTLLVKNKWVKWNIFGQGHNL